MAENDSKGQTQLVDAGPPIPSVNGHKRAVPGFSAQDVFFGPGMQKGSDIKVEQLSEFHTDPDKFIPRSVGDLHTNAAYAQAIADNQIVTTGHMGVETFVWIRSAQSTNVGGRARNDTKEVLVAAARRNFFRRGLSAMFGRGGGDDNAPDAVRGGAMR